MISRRSALILTLAVAALFGLKCGNSGSDDDFSSLMPDINKALASADVDFFAQNAIVGFSMKGPQKEKLPVPAESRGLEDFAVHLREWASASHPALSDQYGDGRLRVYAVVKNRDVFHTVITSIVETRTGPDRRVSALTWRRDAPGVRGPGATPAPSGWVLINELLTDDASPGHTEKDWLTGTCEPCQRNWDKL